MQTSSWTRWLMSDNQVKDASRHTPAVPHPFSLAMVRLSFAAGLSLLVAAAYAAEEKLQVGVKFKPTECPIKSQKGDKLSCDRLITKAVA